MEVFLYLKEISYADNWCAGRRVPMFRASRYLSWDREGTATPDEVYRVAQSVVPYEEVARVLGFSPGQGVMIRGLSIDYGTHSVPVGYISNGALEGFILSFATILSEDLQRRLNKVCCIRVPDVRDLVASISQEYPGAIEHQYVEYTDSDDRDVFLKSSKDCWQCEYRVFFRPNDEGLRAQESLSISIPHGLAHPATPGL